VIESLRFPVCQYRLDSLYDPCCLEHPWQGKADTAKSFDVRKGEDGTLIISDGSDNSGNKQLRA
jgi:hypothetical protein